MFTDLDYYKNMALLMEIRLIEIVLELNSKNRGSFHVQDVIKGDRFVKSSFLAAILMTFLFTITRYFYFIFLSIFAFRFL